MLAADEVWRLQGGKDHRAYRTSDDRYIIVCAIERRFFKTLLELLGIDDLALARQYDQSEWPMQIERFESVFASRTRDEWCALLEGTDACFAPVLSLTEAPQHEHNKSRGTFVDIDGVTQPAPAPRFSRTVSEIGRAPGSATDDVAEILLDWGLSDAEIDELAIRS